MAICLDEKNCDKIVEIQKEIDSYQKCVESSLQQISALNVKYEKTVNELSSIINIFEYINMVTDYKNLFSIINDMLIGVLGVTSSTIFTLEENQFNIETSSISRKQVTKMHGIAQMLIDMKDNMTDSYILDENMLKDDFSRERGIKSAVIVPLIGKNNLMGVIYLEHIIANYFEADDLKYLNTLSVAIRLSLENAQLYAKLEEMALRDGLTDLHNRLFFNKEILNCMENYKKYGLPFMLCMLDIDFFKKVNDEHGHLCGDAVLKEIANILRLHVRRDDIVCRYGGEEFAVIFRNTNDTKNVLQRVEEIREIIQNTTVKYNKSEIKVTCSFGLVSCFACDKSSPTEEIVRYADDSLYEAKRTGRNRVCVYNGN